LALSSNNPHILRDSAEEAILIGSAKQPYISKGKKTMNDSTHIMNTEVSATHCKYKSKLTQQ